MGFIISYKHQTMNNPKMLASPINPNKLRQHPYDIRGTLNGYVNEKMSDRGVYVLHPFKLRPQMACTQQPMTLMVKRGIFHFGP